MPVHVYGSSLRDTERIAGNSRPLWFEGDSTIVKPSAFGVKVNERASLTAGDMSP